MEDNKSPVEISKEELEFIRQLCHSAEEELQELADSAIVDVPDKASNLLNILLLADNIRLQADVGNFTLTFEPKAEYSPESDTRQLHLGYPSIVEKHDHFRSHRINRTNGDIRLSETSGRLKNIHVENVSETGMELASDTPISDIIPGKTVLSLKLRFPDDRWIPCKAAVVRIDHRKNKPTLALRFIKAPKRMHDLLRAYIYHHSPELEHGTEAANPAKPPRANRH